MKTLKKQWLEILSTYQYVLCFCFLGKGIRAGVQLGRWEKGRVEGGSNGTPLRYSCLENPMDGGAWWAAVHGVAKSRTQPSDFTFTLLVCEMNAIAW